MSAADQLVDLQVAIAKYRAWLEEQLQACESGKFRMFSVENGRNIDTTPEHIAQIKRLIADHDKLLATEF